MPTETRRTLSDAEASALRDFAKRLADAQSKSRGAEANIASHQAFLDECDAMIQAGDTSSDWASRRKHCENVQIPEEKAKVKAATIMADRHQKALDTEKAKWKNPTQSGETWTVDA